MDRLFTDTDPKPKPRQHHYSPPPDDYHRINDDRGELLDELDGPVNTEDYNTLTVPLINPVQVQPTCSVVEVHKHNPVQVQPTCSVVEVHKHKPQDLAASNPNARNKPADTTETRGAGTEAEKFNKSNSWNEW